MLNVKNIEGFTLLEMLFVLFVSGLMIALVGPRFSGRIEIYEQHYRLRDVEYALRQLPRRARQHARQLELPRDIALKDFDDGMPILSLPDGWQISFDPPLRISSFGACSQSEIHLISMPSGLDRRYSVAELSCELVSN